jgi:hypothetical protein
MHLVPFLCENHGEGDVCGGGLLLRNQVHRPMQQHFHQHAHGNISLIRSFCRIRRWVGLFAHKGVHMPS